MEFLEKFVIPQSSEHIQLLHYLAMLIFFLFVPFISMVLGGTYLSLFYRNKGIKANDKNFLNFSKDIIEVVTVNKSLGVILGIVPLLTAVLIYAQLLHLGNTTAVVYLSVSFLLVIASLVLIYAYRYSTKFTNVFSALNEVKHWESIPSGKDPEVMNEIAELRDASRNISMKTGTYGISLLLISIWFFISGITIAAFPKEWGEGNFLSILFSWAVIIRFLFFIVMALAFTGGTILFHYFYWEGGKSKGSFGKELSEDYKEFIRKTSVNLTLYSSLILPFLLAVILFSLPDAAISGAVFGYSTLALLLMFLIYNLLYSMIKNANTKYTGILYLSLIVILMSVIIKDQLAVDNATEKQAVILSSKYEEMMAQLTGEGSKIAKVSGQEIYEVRCSSCHAFDHKVVGPPYKQTLPKYEGKLNELVAFILNPKQNNPGYPPMPNPGLKPNEAQAVAKYILSTYKSK